MLEEKYLKSDDNEFFLLLDFCYSIIPKNEHLPLFSELFYNYGKDKIQWVENVRYVGYKFGMFVQSYCIDIPHPMYIKYFIITFDIDRNINLTG